MTAEALINELKRNLDEAGDICESTSLLENLVYDEGTYGLLQRDEIKDIMLLINRLASSINGLYEDCCEEHPDILADNIQHE